MDDNEKLKETIKEIQEEQEKEELREEMEKEEKEKAESDKVEEKKEEKPTEVKEEDKKKKKKKLIIIISSIVAFLIILAVILILLLGGKKTYTITFDTAGGNRIASYTVEKGETIPRPSDPEKEGYKFDGWEYNGSLYYFDLGVTKDMTLKARWVVDTSPKEGDKIKVTLVYNNGDSDTTVEVLYNTRMKEPNDPIYEGYEFNGWYKDGSEYWFGEEVTEPFTLEAKWEKQKDNEYIINFNTDGGSRVESQTVKKGLKVTEPKDPTKEGYDFVEWQLNGQKYDFNKEITGNLTLKAIWKEVITVTFDTKGGNTIPSQKVKYGNTVTKPTDPTREGYYFINWLLKDKVYNFEDKVTESLTLEAKWVKKQITCSSDSWNNPSIENYKVIADFDKNEKVTKVALDFVFVDDDTATTYYNLFKQVYKDTPQLSGKKLTVPNITKNINDQDVNVEYIGMTKDQFINSVKKDAVDVTCE